MTKTLYDSTPWVFSGVNDCDRFIKLSFISTHHKPYMMTTKSCSYLLSKSYQKMPLDRAFLSHSYSVARTNASKGIRSDKADAQVLLKSV